MSAQTKRKHSLNAPELPGKRVHTEEYGDGGDLDLDAQAARQNQPGRRGRVVTEGLESEESEDEDDSGYRQRWRDDRGDKGDNAEEEDDMFADDGGKTEGKQKEKTSAEPRYLKLSEIEGQEFGARTRIPGADTQGDAEQSDDDDEVEDVDPEYELERPDAPASLEDANADAERTPPGSPGEGEQGAQRRKKKGMGFKIDKFNMKAEMAGGRFDEEGNYVWNERDPFAQSDRWLEGNYSKKQIKAAMEAKEKRERRERERQAQDEAEFPTAQHAMKPLAECLAPGQSVLEALQQAGAESKKEKKEKAPGEATARLERITHLTTLLMSEFGAINIYDDTYEALLRQVRRAGLVPEDWNPARKAEPETDDSGDAQWEYKWTPKYLASVAKSSGTSVDPEAKAFGPYKQTELQSWAQQGYFGPDKENILVRRAAADGSQWLSWEAAGL